MYIVDLYPEREIKFLGEHYDRVKYVYNWYKTKDKADPDAWKKIEKYETSLILEPDEELYSYFVDVAQGMSVLFVPKNLRFNHIVTTIQEYYEDEDYDEDKDADISTERIQYFAQQKIVGMSTEWNWKLNSKTEPFESISKYTSDGILYYYEYKYDGDIIKKLELDSIGGVYLIENWWWIAIVAGAVIIGVIVIVVVIVKKKR